MKNLYQSIIVILLIYGCNSAPNIKSNDANTNEKNTEAIIEKEKVTPRVKIDSVKMHAFDNIYFGFQNEPISTKYMINGMEYNRWISKSLPSQGLQYFILENTTAFKTEKYAKKVLTDLKNTISKKYKNVTVLNKSLYIEEGKKGTDPSDKNFMYIYNESRIGQPYEFIACKWDLKYKIIQIGYLVDYIDKMTMTQSTTVYRIYIEFQSKVIKEKKQNEPNYEKNDSSKF